MMPGFPQLLVALTVSAYWFCVALMVARSWLKFRGPAGAIPKTRFERRLWLLWVPVIGAWVALPWQAWSSVRRGGDDGILAQWGLVFPAVRWIAAFLAIGAFGLTVYCWLAMGSSWSMAVTPHKKTNLLTGGPFGLVRHPIYALSLLLMGCTMVVVGTPGMLLVGTLHGASILTKAISEEQYLLQLHGASYADYCRMTGRFVPNWFRLRLPSHATSAD